MDREQLRREQATHTPKDSGLYGATQFYVTLLRNGKKVLSTNPLSLDSRPIELLDHEVGKYELVN